MPQPKLPRHLPLNALLTAALAVGLASPADAAAELERIRIHAVTESHELIAVSAAEPHKIIRSVKLVGLGSDESILGIDYRVAYGVMYALGSSGRLFTVDVETGTPTPVGTQVFALALEGKRFGFDFNPAADRIRIVSDAGQNLRAHPETGTLVDFSPDQDGVQADGRLAYAAGDPAAEKPAYVIAAAYTYNQQDEKLTTNFAIDAGRASLVRQGSIEGTQPVVSPNSGQLHTVGQLGVEGIEDAHFDISDVSNTALAVLTTATMPAATLHHIDLGTGAARVLGPVGSGERLRGMAIEP